MNLGRPFIPHAEAPELMQPGDGPLDDPACGAEPAAVRRSPLGEQRPNPSPPQPCPMWLGVVGPVPLDDRRTRPGAAPSSVHRRNGLNQGKELGHIVGVRAGQDRRERDTLGLAQDMVLAPRFAAVRGVRPGFFPPNTARTDELSTTARDQSSWPAWCSCVRSTW